MTREPDTAPADDAPARTSALHFLADFSAYPTTVLAPEDRFATSALGRRVLNRERNLFVYGDLAEVLDLHLLTRVLSAFSAPASVAAVVERLDAEDPVDASTVSRHTLWLYKYGYLSAH